MNKYETIFIANPDLEDEVIESLGEQILETINSNQGEVVQSESWGTKKLAYEIDGHKAGHYTIINFKGEAETVDELERVYGINDQIIRFMILREEE